MKMNEHFILGLNSYIDPLTKPEIQWENSNYELQTSDSVVLLAQYSINITSKIKYTHIKVHLDSHFI